MEEFQPVQFQSISLFSVWKVNASAVFQRTLLSCYSEENVNGGSDPAVLNFRFAWGSHTQVGNSPILLFCFGLGKLINHIFGDESCLQAQNKTCIFW
jgi:hypothetical protein